MPTLYVQKENGNEVAIDELVPGLRFLKLTTKPAAMVSNYQTVNGRDGERQHGQYTYGPGTATADFFFKGYDYPDFRLAHAVIAKLFHDRRLLRIRDSIEPNVVFYGAVQDYDMAALNFIDSQFSITFDIPAGYRYSLKRSDAYTDGEFGIEMSMSQATNYTFSSSSFQVYNPSDIDVDPFEQNHDLVITMQVDGSPTLTNTTTGRSFSCTRNLNHDQKLVLNGVDATIDGNPVAPGDTNWGDINLKANGWNNMTVTGCTVSSITFSFPFILTL